MLGPNSGFKTGHIAVVAAGCGWSHDDTHSSISKGSDSCGARTRSHTAHARARAGGIKKEIKWNTRKWSERSFGCESPRKAETDGVVAYCSLSRSRSRRSHLNVGHHLCIQNTHRHTSSKKKKKKMGKDAVKEKKVATKKRTIAEKEEENEDVGTVVKKEEPEKKKRKTSKKDDTSTDKKKKSKKSKDEVSFRFSVPLI